MAKLSGATKQSLAQLLDSNATHSVIESLYLRFDVKPLPSDTNPNKLTKATHLVRELDGRQSGNTTLMSLINYVGSPAFPNAAFRRGSPAAKDLYENLDNDLELGRASPSPANAPRQTSPPRERVFLRPGTAASEPPKQEAPASRRYVFVVRGRDQTAYNSLAALLNALDLRIVTWDDAARGAGGGSPHTLDIVRAGIEMASAVVVLMTPDDLGSAKPEFHVTGDDPREARPSGQARQNVVFEAGWAMALDQDHVILVRVGDVRKLSDVDGLNYVQLTGDLSSRRQLIGRLRSCDLDVDDSGELWRTAGTFPDAA